MKRPQVSDALSLNADPRSVPATSAAWTCIRTIIVPPDIVAVQRRSAVRVKKATPWRPQPDGQVTTTRAGDRDWFSDNLFVESQAGHARTGYGTSVTVHICLAAALIGFLVTRPDRLMVVTLHRPLVMIVSAPAVQVDAGPSSRPVKEPASPKMAQPLAPIPAPARGTTEDDTTAAPIVAPLGIAPETGAENRVRGIELGVSGGISDGMVGGVPGGITGGVVGGVIGGSPATVIRIGANMEPPRKIKDVKPIYPAAALPARAQGAVIIETTIGPDGRVQDTKVMRSVPALDRAALDAVRQWEYMPSLLNGVRVAVIMTVVVNFAMQ